MNILQVVLRKENEENDDYMKLLGSLGSSRTARISGVYITEVLTLNDPRRWMFELDDATKRKITGMMDRTEFQVFLKEDLPPNVNIL